MISVIIDVINPDDRNVDVAIGQMYESPQGMPEDLAEFASFIINEDCGYIGEFDISISNFDDPYDDCRRKLEGRGFQFLRIDCSR